MKKYTSATVAGVVLLATVFLSIWLGLFLGERGGINLAALCALYAWFLFIPSIGILIVGVVQTRRYNRVISAAYANGVIPVDVIAQDLGRPVKKVREILYEAIYKEHLSGIVKDGIYHDLRVATYIDTRAVTRSELASNYV